MNYFANIPHNTNTPLTGVVINNSQGDDGRINSYINSAALSVYQQAWWLNIAKQESEYREIHVLKDGTAVASLPFIVQSNKVGLKLGLTPIWSRLGGPILNQALDDVKKSDVLRELILRLPRDLSYKFVVSPASADAELIRKQFKEAGFVQTCEITYLQRPDDPGILERVNTKHKKHFKYAERDLEVIDISAYEFTEFYAANLKSAGRRSYASLKIAGDLIKRGQEGVSRQVRVTAVKRKKEGAPLDAAIACAWDDNRYYLWMLSRRHTLEDNPNEKKPHGDAVKLLILKATEHARELGLTFDADGATTEGAHKLYGEVLRFPRSEERYVFMRNTKTYKLYSLVRSEVFDRKIQARDLKTYVMNSASRFLSKLRSRRVAAPAKPE